MSVNRLYVILVAGSLAIIAVGILAGLRLPGATDCYVERLAPLPDSVGFGGREEIAIAALGPDGQYVEATFVARRPSPGLVIITAIGRCGGTAVETITVPDSASFTLPFGELPSPLAPPPPDDGTRAV